jgi:hypothetical protein
MMNPRIFLITLLLSLAGASAGQAAGPSGGALAGERFRVVVSTDIGGSDPDDFQSMVHYLMYADLFDTEGLIASPPHAGRKQHLLEVLDAYAVDYPKLKARSGRFPTPDALRAVTKQGAIDAAPPAGHSAPTEGSRWIVERARADDPRPLWVLVWGSITDVAQALHDEPGIKRRLRVYFISSWNRRMDQAARDYVVRQHLDLWLIKAETTFRGMYAGGKQAGDLGNREFIARHVKGHGALGNLLAAKKADIKMGDTPSVLYLMRGPADDPTADHWGGAFVRPNPERTYWTDNPDPALREGTFAGAKTVNRWREDYLRDWQGRMVWLKPEAGPDGAASLPESPSIRAAPAQVTLALSPGSRQPPSAKSDLTLGPGLQVTALGKSYQPDPRRVVVQQSRADPGGSTSIRNTGRAHLEWKTNGYFQRNRDLGQVFTPPRDFRLNALVLRTGPSDAAVLAGMPGSKVFVQFFEVTGEPRIHDNGTPPGTDAKHGFSRNHRCDDFLTGVEYRPLGVVNGGTFPALPATRDLDGRPTGNEVGRLVYLRWQLAGEARLTFQAGKRYAFMVGCEEPGRARGFTLANANAASVNARPSLTDAHDRYPGGWGLRREGDGTLPPTMFPGAQPPGAPAQLGCLHREALFAEGPSRYSLSPTTDGFPDVDTYRDLEFYLEADASAPASSRRTNEPICKP